MGSSLMCNDANVCDGRRGLIIWVRDSSEMSKSLRRNYSMVFAVRLVCWECREASLLMRVHTNHLSTMSWSSSLIGSNVAL